MLANACMRTFVDILWKVYKVKLKSSISFAHDMVLHFVNAGNLKGSNILFYSQDDQ